jgi:hypothetical protein
MNGSGGWLHQAASCLCWQSPGAAAGGNTRSLLAKLAAAAGILLLSCLFVVSGSHCPSYQVSAGALPHASDQAVVQVCPQYTASAWFVQGV